MKYETMLTEFRLEIANLTADRDRLRRQVDDFIERAIKYCPLVHLSCPADNVCDDACRACWRRWLEGVE